jgi:hypothetical protein
LPNSSITVSSRSRPEPSSTCRTSEYPLECSPEEAIAITVSPTSTRSRLRISLSSTTPTPVAEMSYSSGRSTPGCSAVSPPSSEQPAYRQPSEMPAPISATFSGTTSPQAM